MSANAAPPRRRARSTASRKAASAPAGSPDAAQRFAEARQRGEPRALVAGDGQGREHALEVTHRLLEGQQSERAYPGLAPVADGLRRVRRLRRFEEVVRQGGEPLLVGRPRRLEGLGDGSVEGAPRGGGEALVERLAQECVGERVAPQGARDLPQQAEREGRAEGLEKRAGRLLQHPGQRSELERSAHHRGRLEQAQRRRSQGLEALAQQLLRARRDGGTEPAVRGGTRAPRRQELRQLDHEERVPLGHREHALEDVVARGVAEAVREELLDRAARETRERHARSEAQHRREQRGPLRVFLGLDVAQRGDHEERHRPELPRQELEEQQRSHVGPVQVVDHEEEGTGASRGGERAGDAVEELEARPLGGAVGRRSGLGCAEQRKHRGDLLGGSAGRVGRVARERLHDRPVDRRSLARVAAPPDRGGAPLARLGGEGGRRPGLPDAGLADEEHEAPLAAARGLELGPEQGALGLATHETIRRRHPRDYRARPTEASWGVAIVPAGGTSKVAPRGAPRC